MTALESFTRKARTFLNLIQRPDELARVMRDKYAVRRQALRSVIDRVVPESLSPRRSEAFYFPLKTRVRSRYKQTFGRKPNLRKPTRYTEKIQWRKVYCPQITLLSQVTDKVGVYDYVRHRIGDDHLLDVIWVSDDPTPDALRALGDEVVLQPTHRSGQVVFIEKSEYIDFEKLSAYLQRMLIWPYSMLGQEPWYGYNRPRIIARPMVTNADGIGFLSDCKFHMFRQSDGSYAAICEVINTYPHWRAIFDSDYNRLDFDLDPFTYPPPETDPTKPPFFDEMLDHARTLAEGFDNVRVDFMMGADTYYFTELTFAPAGGRQRITPAEWDEKLGALWHLDTGTFLQRCNWKARAWSHLWRTEWPMRVLRRLYRYRDDWAIVGIRQADYDTRFMGDRDTTDAVKGL